MRALLLLCSCCFSALAFAQAPEPILQYDIDDLGLAHLTVASSPDVYHVLKAINVGSTSEHLVAIKLGESGQVSLRDPLPALPQNAYRLYTYTIANSGDADGDGRDDISELNDANNLAPLNHAMPVDRNAGTVSIPDTALFRSLSIGSNGGFSYLAGSVFTKVYITNNTSTDSLELYFIDVGNYVRHSDFAQVVGIPIQPSGLDLADDSRGTVVYHPDVVAPNGVQGLYTYQFRSFDEYDFELIQRIHDLIAANMPFLQGNLAYRPIAETAFDGYARERARYDASRVQVVSEEELFGDLDFAGLNQATGFGILRKAESGFSPGPFDIIVLDALPNTLQRVGGIISSTLQTPLSHVNLRAIQDNVPNCYVKNAKTDPRIEPLFDQFVSLTVTADTFLIRSATRAEVDEHFESLRPDTIRKFAADFERTSIESLDNLGFTDASGFGAKATNLAEMRNFGFVAGTLPDGFAIPFAFYRDFMERNGLFAEARAMLADPSFSESFEQQEQRLKEFRRQIKDGSFSPDRYNELSELQAQFPATTPIRCRSSTNGEDLPGFSGAGLYDSKTQNIDEGHIEKSIKQVFASIWNFRAFIERDFYRIDHFSAMMGVLVHPSYKEEVVNGVAVSFDPVYERTSHYYINAQLGENLVTNPEDNAVPEEIMLERERGSGVGFNVIRRSNLVPFGERVLDSTYLNQLRPYLRTIHDRFAILYDAVDDPAFAMEIEFKVDSSAQLAIKQARPWAGYTPPERIPEPTVALPAQHLALYPNPVTEPLTLEIDTDLACVLEFEVYTVLGQQVLSISRQISPDDARVKLPEVFDNLTPGVYIYRIRGCNSEGKSGVLYR